MLYYRYVPTRLDAAPHGRISLCQDRLSECHETRSDEPQTAYTPIALSRTIYGSDIALSVLCVALTICIAVGVIYFAGRVF